VTQGLSPDHASTTSVSKPAPLDVVCEGAASDRVVSFGGADFTVFLAADGLDQLTIKGIAHTAWTADLLA
jgi:hypothetical protein